MPADPIAKYGVDEIMKYSVTTRKMRAATINPYKRNCTVLRVIFMQFPPLQAAKTCAINVRDKSKFLYSLYKKSFPSPYRFHILLKSICLYYQFSSVAVQVFHHSLFIPSQYSFTSNGGFASMILKADILDISL